MNQTIYVFSGLGADERVFQNMDFGDNDVQFIPWITPNKTETIESYAARIKSQIRTENPVLIGLSFGGMMAIEVAKQIETRQLILIASAKNKFEIPKSYRVAGMLKLDKVVPIPWLKSANRLTYWFFGAHSNDEKKLLNTILKNTDPEFIRWAIGQIIRWKNQQIIPHVIHIHGTSDKILPYRHIDSPLKIVNGGHLMTLNKSEEIAGLIRSFLYF